MSLKLKADLLMLFATVVWGFTFIAQTLGMKHLQPFTYTAFRFFIATIALTILNIVLNKQTHTMPTINYKCIKHGLILGIALATAMNFQQVGLLYTSVTNSGFITSLYVVIVPVIYFILGNTLTKEIVISIVLALMGLLLLTEAYGLQLQKGDLLQLCGACLWSVHVLLTDIYAKKYNPFHLSLVQFATCCVASGILSILFENMHTAYQLYASLPAVMFGGLLGAATGFTLQVYAQKHADVTHVAIILSLESVFAAIAASIFLAEKLRPLQYLGAFLMFTAALLAGIPKHSWKNLLTKNKNYL